MHFTFAVGLVSRLPVHPARERSTDATHRLYPRLDLRVRLSVTLPALSLMVVIIVSGLGTLSIVTVMARMLILPAPIPRVRCSHVRTAKYLRGHFDSNYRDRRAGVKSRANVRVAAVSRNL